MTEKIVAYSAAQVNGSSDLGGESVSEPFVATQVTEAGAVAGVSVSGLFTAVQAEDGYNFVAYDNERSSGADESEMWQVGFY